MSATQPTTPILATAAVIRALNGLDQSSKLAVLALAERVIRRHQRPTALDLTDIDVRLGQTWVTARINVANRRIILSNGCVVGYETSRTTGLATLGEFAQWVQRHGARAVT